MRILVAEDDPVSRRFLERRLEKWGYEVICAEDGDEAWAALASEDAPRLAILDWMMPGMDGLDICRALRADTRGPYTYVILVTGRDRREDVLEGLGSGADDYLTKPVDIEQLEVRLRAARRIVDLQEQLIAAREALRYQAEHDVLTGLPTRARIFDLLANEIDRGSRQHQSVGVLMTDVDHFKNVNDTYGHVVGDAVLRGVASRLRGGCRRYDTVGRYGGEEFVAVLPGCDDRLAAEVAERLRTAVSANPIHTPAGEVPVTVSIGVATSGAHPPRTDALVHAADIALYRAKRGGRNRVVVAGNDIPPLGQSEQSPDKGEGQG